MPALDPYWSLQLLGGLVARHASAELSRFRTHKTAALLAYLAFYRFRSHPRDLLIDLLWPDASPDAGPFSLSKALSSLRHQLHPAAPPAGSVFRVDRLSLALNPEALTTDVAQFETSLVAAQRASRPGERAQHLEEVARLYRGELLPGFYEEWVVRE